mgnify:CR=1 FL=1
MLGDICIRLLFCHISPFSVFSCPGTIPLCGVKCFLPSITVPLCAAVAVSVLPAPPAGYGLPAAECLSARFPALPVPSYLSSCLFRWLWLWLPTVHFLLKGRLIIGATVTSEKTLKGTITDLDGKFSLEIPENTNLAISYVGYRNQIVKGYSNMIIRMQEDSRMLDEVVVVGYGTQRKGNLTGAVSSVKADKLTIAPVATASNTLVGQLPGLIATQSSGQPGSDSATLNVRGFGSALIIVDGIEASLDNIDANQIESISILKDGAASIYGARAGNGVILITTKRGTDQKPTITLNTTFTWQGVTKMLKPASSGQRAEMEREAWLQSGQPEASASFTEDQIQKYYDGTDPLFPNTNWYKELIRVGPRTTT